MRRLSILPILCLLALPGVLAAQDASDDSLAVESFDRAWAIIDATYFDTTFAGLDWPGIRDELRPQVVASPDRATVRRVLREMLDRFGQSHFSLIPHEIADSLDPEDADVSGAIGNIGVDVRLLDDQVVVTKVDTGSSAARAGVRPGWIMVAVGDDRIDDLIARARSAETRRHVSSMVWAAVYRRLQGNPGTDCRIEFLDGSDEPVELTLTRTPTLDEPVKFGNLPTMFARFDAAEVRTPTGGRAGTMWFNYWMVPIVRQLDAAIEEFRDADGLVIDLRGNGGGVGGMVMGVAGHILNERVTLGTMKTRTNNLQFRANPRRVNQASQPVEPYSGPVAILIDRLSGSASEVFAGGLQSIERVRVFGDTSAGAVLPAVMDRLPNRDVLYHAIGDFETADGVRLEGRGVYPDEPVALDRAALLAGTDPVLEAALAWIAANASRGSD